MDKFIKINSNQSKHDAVQNLLDFPLPNGPVYDLSESYININMSLPYTEAHETDGTVEAGTGTINYEGGRGVQVLSVKLNNDLTGSAADTSAFVPSVCLVKNASMSCRQRGAIEDIRRVDTIKSILYNYTNDIDGQGDSSAEQIRPPLGYQEFEQTPFAELVGKNIVNNAVAATGTPETPIADGLTVLGLTSRMLDHDLKIKLSDIFDFCKTPAYSTSVYGDAKISLEMNFDKLQVHAPLQNGAAIWGRNIPAALMARASDALVKAFEDITATGASPINMLTQAATFTDAETECPFYVGQRLEIKYTHANVDGGGATIGAKTVERIINKIGFVAVTNGTITQQKAVIGFATDLIAADKLVNNDTIAGISAKGVNPVGAAVVINSAEIVLKTLGNPQNVPSKISYTTYSTEEDHAGFKADVNKYVKQVLVEPECSNLIVAFPSSIAATDHPATLSSHIFKDYRIRSNNVELTNRNILQGSSNDYDRLSRGLMNMGLNLSNLKEAVHNASHKVNNHYGQNAADDASGQRQCAIIEPMEMTPATKIVNFELGQLSNANKLGYISFYKQLVRTI